MPRSSHYPDPDPVAPFEGAKLAVFYRGRVLSLLRDDIATIPFPGMWDLPGGGREGDETALDCALRETWEETNLVIGGDAVTWQRCYPGDGKPQWFFAAQISSIDGLRLGEEGQALHWFPPEAFLAHPRAIAHLQDRLAAYLAERSAGA